MHNTFKPLKYLCFMYNIFNINIHLLEEPGTGRNDLLIYIFYSNFKNSCHFVWEVGMLHPLIRITSPPPLLIYFLMYLNPLFYDR